MHGIATKPAIRQGRQLTSECDSTSQVRTSACAVMQEVDDKSVSLMDIVAPGLKIEINLI